MPWVVTNRCLVFDLVMSLKEAADQDVIIDVMHDDGSGFETIFVDPGDRPRIPSGDIGPIAFDLEADGFSFIGERLDVVRVDLAQTGTISAKGEDLTVQLQYALLPVL
jgi:hypothetical protein